jgi:hypothetical protein
MLGVVGVLLGAASLKQRGDKKSSCDEVSAAVGFGRARLHRPA